MEYLYRINPDEALEALEIAERVRRNVELMRPMVDEKPGRNLRWETGREIDRLSSFIGDEFRTGRVLVALSLELQDEYGLALTKTPEEERQRHRDAWEARLAQMGVSRQVSR